MRILIIKLGALGDVLRTTAILEGLKEKYNTEIDWFTKKNAAELLKNNKLIDNIYTDAGDLGEYELVLSLDEDGAEIAAKAGRKIIGCYNENGEKKYTSDSASWFDMGLISKFGKQRADELKKLNKKTYQQHLAEMLGVDVSDYVFNLNKEEKIFAKKFKEKNKIKGFVVGLNTGAGSRWEMKKLSIEKTVKLAEKLVKEFDAKVVLFGGPEEVERNKEIMEKTKVDIIDACCGNLLREFAALIDLCDVLVTSDTLALHFGIALKKKIIAFFGPTSAAEVDLYKRGKKIIAKSDCYCCYKKKIEEGIYCTDEISVDEILDGVEELRKSSGL